MNELIAQLAERAAQEAEENDLALEVSTDEKTYQVPAGFIEKFSELIVRECATEAHRRVCTEGNDNMIYVHLLEHFGVEE